MEATHRARLKTLLLWAWTLSPFLLLVACVVRYHVDVVFHDQWSLVPLVEKSYQGTLTLRDFLASHNGHRFPLSKLWMLGLIRLSSWNLLVELIGNILLTGALFLILRHQMKLTFQSVKAPQPVWLLPILSTLLFSLKQSGNWLFGYHAPFFLNAFFAVLGLFLLAAPTLSWARLWVSFGLGLAATGSFSNGILFWPVGLWVLFTRRDHLPFHRGWIGLWGLLGAGLIAVLLWIYPRTPSLPSWNEGARHPMELFRFILGFLGNSVSWRTHRMDAQWTAVFGLGLLVWSTQRLRGAGKVPPSVWVPYWALAFYALGTAGITGIGRVALGAGHSLSPRYILMANLFWIPVLVFLALLIARNSPRRGFAMLCTAGIAFAVTFSSLRSIETFRALHARTSLGREELFRLKDDSKLQILNPRPDLIRERVGVLQKRRLSAFRK